MKGLRQTSCTDNLANRKLIVINCQSLLSKKDLFFYFVSNHNPDFVVGSESWLTHSILNSEVFPSNFTVFRKDQDGGHGGVFIACRSSIECKSIEIDTECELVACEVVQSSGPSLVTGLHTMILYIWKISLTLSTVL